VSPSDHLVARIRASLGRIDPRMEWPHGFVRLGVTACVAVTVVVGLVYYVRAVDRLGSEASRNAAANYDDREFGGGNSLRVDKSALYEARGRIPEDETYRVVAGLGVAEATDLTEPHIGEYARYFLMPRRPDPDAPWVLCYRCDLSSFDEELQIVWQNDAGIALGRLPG
jgi:hypothetical protein